MVTDNLPLSSAVYSDRFGRRRAELGLIDILGYQFGSGNPLSVPLLFWFSTLWFLTIIILVNISMNGNKVY